MLPQSSKKGISILRQTTLYRPISFTCVLFVPNSLNTSFVNKLDYLPFFEKQNFNTCTAWLPIKTLCVNQLLITTDEFIQNFETKTQTHVVVLDFSEAFDVVPNQSLLHKLDHYGIRRTTLKHVNWIQNFLTNRTQKVVVDGSSSESAGVRSCVP